MTLSFNMIIWIEKFDLINPNVPAPSRSPQKFCDFFYFLKVHNELGKVTKFWTSRPLFSWRNSHLKKVRADSSPPHPNKVNFQVFLERVRPAFLTS